MKRAINNGQNIIYEKINRKYKLPVYIVYIDFLEQEAIKIDKHWHRSLEIILPVLNGTVVWIEGVEEIVYPEDVVIINSKLIHSCWGVDSSMKYKGIALQLDYDFCKKLYPEFDYLSFYSRVNQDVIKEIIDCIYLIERTVGNYENENILLVNGYCQILLGLLVKYQKREDKYDQYTISAKRKDLLVELIGYLERNYDQPFDTEELSKALSTSYGYLAKIFKESLHMTIGQYINQLRVEACKQEMINTDLSILTIALAQGFPNIKSFNKSFKEKYNKTPNQYREMYKR